MDTGMNRYVPPCGDIGTAEVVIVGEQPGTTEVFKRKPFVGASGSLLRNFLRFAKFHPDTLYFTNVFKDLDNPLEEYLHKPTRGAPVLSQKGEFYLKTLQVELEGLKKAKVIIAVGNVALWALTKRWGITKWAGSILDCDFLEGVKIVPVIHPATCLPPKLVYTNRYLILADLQRAYEVYKGTVKYDRVDLKIQPSFEEAMEFLSMIQEEGKQGRLIGFDTEIHMYNKQLTCVSFSVGTKAIAIPFVWDMGDYFSLEREIAIMTLIRDILEDHNITKVIQNVGFDATVMLKNYGIRINNYHDTMIAQHTIAPDFPKGLDFITSRYTTLPYYKDDGKEFIFKAYGGWDTFWRYSALDAVVLTIAFPKQVSLLKRHENYETYVRRLGQIPAIVYAQLNGVRIDMERFRLLKERLKTESDVNYAELLETVGKVINPNSSRDLQKYFYDELGMTPYRNKKGKITADKDALKRLTKPTEKREASREAQLILDIKGVGKLLSTYLVDEKIDADGRIRCSYNPCGTRYERLSSSKNIYGTGTNLQNVPHSIFKAFVPEPGHFYAAFDLSQAENRIVAYVANCRAMMKAFEEGIDIHSQTAQMLMEIYYDGRIPTEITVKSLSPIGDGTKTWRDWGKRLNHGLNYDLAATNFALMYGLSVAQARFIVEAYHKMYAEVRKVFHNYVKNSIKEHKYVTNLLGWRNPFLGDTVNETFRKGYASIPQGSVGGIVAETMYLWATTPKLYKMASLLLQVHDSLGFSVPKGTTEEEWCEIAEVLLTVKTSLERPLKTHLGRTFNIPADLVINPDSLEKESGVEIKAYKIPKNVKDFAKLLKESVDGLSR